MGSPSLTLDMVSRARKSCWSVLVLMLLADSVMAGVRVRRQEDNLLEEEESELGRIVKLFDELEESLLESLESLIVNQEAQDRILLEDVQNLIFAVQSISDDPSLTPVALAAIATNPTSLFLIGSLVASTVLASQVSSFALVGQTLTFDSNQGGIIGFFLDIINSLIRGFNSVTGDTVEIDETEHDGSGSGSGMGESLEDDYFVLDGSGDEQEQVAGAEAGGLMESLSLLIRTLLGGHQDDLDEEEEGSGSVSLDIRPDSLLDVVLNIIPNTVAGITGFSQQEEEDYFYDELNQVGITGDPSDGGSTVGGMTISLHSMDLAKLFVDVQKSIIENTTGFNCSCGEDILNEESIKNATFSLLEEAVEEKRKRQLSLKKKKRSYLRSRIPKLLQI